MRCCRPLLLLVAVAIFAVAGCQKFAIERHGRPCGGLGDCIDGFTCDERSDTCIATGDPCELEGLVSPCELGAGTCVNGCRWCENDAWTECRPGVGEECEPGVTLCGTDTLVVCNLNGFIAEETDCGEPGCNRDVWPPRCNECLLRQTRCGARVTRANPVGNVEAEVQPRYFSSNCARSVSSSATCSSSSAASSR